MHTKVLGQGLGSWEPGTLLNGQLEAGDNDVEAPEDNPAKEEDPDAEAREPISRRPGYDQYQCQ